jgi:hypothetical protein
MFIHWCDGNAIKADALAMMVNVVGTNDGSEFVVHCMSDLLAHRTFSDVVSNEALGDLVARDLIAEYKVGSTISEVIIAIAVDGVKG